MKILYVEDELAHVELTQRTLEDNFQDEFVLFHCESLREALNLLHADSGIDIVLADLRLPDGSGLDLLFKIQQFSSPPAVVLVTGQGDQEVAVTALKAGAADYLVKQSDYLHRLPVVITNAVAQNRLKREQAAKLEAEVKYQTLVEQTPAVVFLDKADEAESTLYISPRIEELTGYSPEQWISGTDIWLNALHPDDRNRVHAADKISHVAGEPFREEYRFIRRDGRVIWIKEDTFLIRDSDGKPLYWQGILLDITQEKENEAALQRQLLELSVLQSATAAGTESYSENEIIEKVTKIIGRIYPEVCGILILNDDGTLLTPHPSYLGANITNWQKGYPVTEGITGRAVTSGRVIRLGDVTTDPAFIQIAENMISELCIPIQVSKRVIGVINIESRKPDAFSENDEKLLETIASGLGTALERLRLFRQEQQRSKELETLYQTTKLLTQTLQPQTIAESLIAILEQFLGYEFCTVAILDENKQQLVPLAISHSGKDREAYSLNLQAIADRGFQPGIGISGWVVQNSRTVRLGDATQDTRYVEIIPGIRSELCVPLVSRGKTIGILNIETHQPDAYSQKDEDILTALASSAAIAFENARLFQEQTRRSNLIETLAEIANEIATTRDVIPALEKTTQRTLELLKANHVAIYLVQDDGVTLKPVTSFGSYRKEILDYSPRIGEGITGKVFLKGTPEIVNNMAEDPRRVQVPGTPEEDAEVETLMSCPLILRGRPIGVVNAWRHRQEGLFNETELNFLVSIANQASVCIESGRLFQETKRQAQEAAAIAEVGRYIASTLQLDLVLERIASYAKDLLNAETTAVYLVIEGTPMLSAIAALGSDTEAIKNDPLTLGAGILGNIALQKEGEIVNDTANDPRTITIKGTELLPDEHVMGVPILFNDALVGLLAVWRTGTGEEFIPAELEFTSRLAQQAAFALENARLYQKELERREQAEILREVTAQISTTLDINKLYQIILDSLSKLIPHDSSSIFLERDPDEMEIVAARGFQNPASLIGKTFHRTSKWHELALNRSALIMPDAQDDARFEKWEHSRHIHGWMGVPMISQEKVIGFINLDSRKLNAFTERDATLVQTFANSAAVAIQNAMLFETQRRQFERETSILNLMRTAASSLDLNQVLNIILGQLIKLLKADSGSIQLLENDRLRVATAIGFDAQLFAEDGTVLVTDFPLNQRVLASQQAILVDDILQETRYIRIKGLESIRSFLLIPLVANGQSIGLVTLDHAKPDYFTQRDMETGMAIADNASIAITNARLYAETRRRLKELEIINRVSTSLRVTQSLNEMLPILLNESLELINTHNGSIWLYDQSTNMLRQQISSGVESNLKYTAIPPYQGIVGNTFTTGQKYLSPEIVKDPLLFEGNRESLTPGLSGICVPIQSTAGPVGVLMVSVEMSRQISDEINLLVILAEITGNAIHRSQLYEQSQRQVKRLTTLRDIDAAIASSFDLRLTLNILMDQTLSHLGVDAVDIALFHPDIQTITYFIGSGFRTPSPTRPLMRIGEGLAGRVIMRQQTIHLTDLQNTPETRNEILIKREGFVEYVGIPLIVKGQIKGVFEVFHRSALSPTPDWMDFLHTLAGQAAIAIDNSHLFENLQRSNQELMQAYDTTLEGWARALELRDRETEGHTRRVTELTLRLARYMGIKDSELVNIRRGVLLHDIGKMGVPDNILKKTGPLSDSEWDEMRQHPVYAYNLLAPIEYLRDALEIPYCHHEHWDGSGYPRGLKGNQIPLSARIFSIIDIWDALLSDRTYRKAWTADRVTAYLKEIAGTHIDPNILPIFFKMIEETESTTG